MNQYGNHAEEIEDLTKVWTTFYDIKRDPKSKPISPYEANCFASNYVDHAYAVCQDETPGEIAVTGIMTSLCPKILEANDSFPDTCIKYLGTQPMAAICSYSLTSSDKLPSACTNQKFLEPATVSTLCFQASDLSHSFKDSPICKKYLVPESEYIDQSTNFCGLHN